MRSLGNASMIYISLRLLFTSRNVALSERESWAIVSRIVQALASVRYIELQWPDPHTVDIRRDGIPSHRMWWQVNAGAGDRDRMVEGLVAYLGHAVRSEWTKHPIRGAVERALMMTS
jgi:hypothetical protein